MTLVVDIRQHRTNIQRSIKYIKIIIIVIYFLIIFFTPQTVQEGGNLTYLAFTPQLLLI